MKKQDWNWVALLCMGNLFAGILKQIIQSITGKEVTFGIYFLLYGVFYILIAFLFAGTGLLEHKKFLQPLLIYLGITAVSVLIVIIISISLDINHFDELLTYIVVAVLGMVACGIGHKRC